MIDAERLVDVLWLSPLALLAVVGVVVAAQWVRDEWETLTAWMDDDPDADLWMDDTGQGKDE